VREFPRGVVARSFFPRPPRPSESRRARSSQTPGLARNRLLTRCTLVVIIPLIVITLGVITGI